MDEKYVVNAQLHIPAHELSFRFTTGGGPGGQHVNKVATRVLLSFDVANSPSLTNVQRERIMTKLANRIDKDGVLQLSVQESRSQKQNRDIAVDRLLMLLAEALKVPKKRRATRPSRAVREKRLDAKRRRGDKKRDRGKRYFPE